MTEDERAARFAAKTDELVSALRAVGLYENRVLGLDPERSIAVVDFYVGDLAFAPRVQDPGQDDTDRAFSQLETSFIQSDVPDIVTNLKEMDW